MYNETVGGNTEFTFYVLKIKGYEREIFHQNMKKKKNIFCSNICLLIVYAFYRVVTPVVTSD